MTDALTADSLLEVLRFKLTVLIIAVGLFDGDGHDIEHVCRLLEDGIHLFQGAVARLGEEEVDKGEDKCVSVIVSSSSGSLTGIVHNSKDDVGFVPDAVECNRGNHHDHEVEDPVGAGEES